MVGVAYLSIQHFLKKIKSEMKTIVKFCLHQIMHIVFNALIYPGQREVLGIANFMKVAHHFPPEWYDVIM